MGVLSQEDVNTLLCGLSGMDYIDEETGEAMKNEDSPERIFRSRLPRLELICDRYAWLLSQGLSERLSHTVEFNPISIDVTKFGQFMRSLPVPTAISVFKSHIFGNFPFFGIFDARAVFATIELVMGGRGHFPLIEGREFTEIEKIVIEDMANVSLSCFQSAWRDVILDFSATYDRTKFNPQFASDLGFDENCVVITYELEYRTSLGLHVQIIPAKGIQSYLPVLESKDCLLKVATCSGSELLSRLSNRQYEHSRKSCPDRDDYLSFLNDRDTFRVFQALQYEHPQTLAFLLSYLHPRATARFICEFPSSHRAEIISRMSQLNKPSNNYLSAIDAYLYEVTTPSFSHSKPQISAVLDCIGEISHNTKQEITNEILEECPTFFDSLK